MAKHNALPKGITLKINGSFAVAVMVKGVRKTGTAKTLAEAVALREALKAAIERGDETMPVSKTSESWTFKTAVVQTQVLVWGLKNNPKAKVYAKDVASYFGPDTRLDAVWGADPVKPSISLVDKYVEHCKARGNSGSTINRKLTALSVMLKTAKSRNMAGDLAFVPKMPRQPEGERRVRYLSQVSTELEN